MCGGGAERGAASTPRCASFLHNVTAMLFRAVVAVACFPLALSLTPADYGRLDGGEPVIALIPSEGRHIAIRAATKIDADPGRLIEWTRHIEDFQRSSYVRAIGRFSQPPRIEDLETLTLDEDDLSALRRCRPGKCDVKLDDDEIVRMRMAAEQAGADWRRSVQLVFRAAVLERAQRYLAEGLGPSAAYHDRKTRIHLESEFLALTSDVALVYPSLFPLTNYLALYPSSRSDHIESFLYWSKEELGAKPIVSVTHVAMTASGDDRRRETLVAKKQIYASHYILAALSFTAITTAANGRDRYLVYLNHSRSDVFDGLFGGFIRRVIQRRLRAEGPPVLDQMRRRLESVAP